MFDIFKDPEYAFYGEKPSDKWSDWERFLGEYRNRVKSPSITMDDARKDYAQEKQWEAERREATKTKPVTPPPAPATKPTAKPVAKPAAKQATTAPATKPVTPAPAPQIASEIPRGPHTPLPSPGWNPSKASTPGFRPAPVYEQQLPIDLNQLIRQAAAPVTAPVNKPVAPAPSPVAKTPAPSTNIQGAPGNIAGVSAASTQIAQAPGAGMYYFDPTPPTKGPAGYKPPGTYNPNQFYNLSPGFKFPSPNLPATTPGLSQAPKAPVFAAQEATTMNNAQKVAQFEKVLRANKLV